MDTGRTDEGNPFLAGDLGEEQEAFLRVVLRRVITMTARVEDATWPSWQSVRGTLRQHGYDAAAAARSLPTVARSARYPYGPFWRSDFGAGEFRQTEKVGLTIAGLHLVDPIRADRLVQLIALFAHMEVNLDYSSDDVETENVSFNDHAGGYLGEELHRADVGAMSIAAAAELLRHEYIPVVDIPRPGIYEVRLRSGELSRYEGLSDAREYLRIVVEQARAADSVRLPRVPLGYPTTTRGDVYIDNYNHYGGNNAIQSQVGSQHSVPDPPSSRRLRDEET